MSRLPRPHPHERGEGIGDPLEMLLGCHRRIERELAALQQLAAHVEHRGVDVEASSAAHRLLRYFERAAANHHEDEEQDLFPLLASRITDAGETARFGAFRAILEEDHLTLESAWARLRRPLEAIVEGRSRKLAEVDVKAFVGAYAKHIRVEEIALTEFFDRWLVEGDREALGRAMEVRRQDPQ